MDKAVINSNKRSNSLGAVGKYLVDKIQPRWGDQYIKMTYPHVEIGRF